MLAGVIYSIEANAMKQIQAYRLFDMHELGP